MRKLTPLLFLAFLAAAPRGSEVHIAFSGVIAHIFDDAHGPRAVAMRGAGHMLHHATLHIPQASIASSEVPLACDSGDCVLELQNVALRFPGSGRARYAAGGSFDSIVPHLRAVTNGEMSALRADLSGVVSAAMDLPAGNLTATPFDMKGRYDPDFENRGNRPFPQSVFLDGVIARPELLVRHFGETSWQRITFTDDELVELRMVNEPAAGMPAGNHELLFYDLAARPLATQPMIVAPPTRLLTIDINCSSSQWP